METIRRGGAEGEAAFAKLYSLRFESEVRNLAAKFPSLDSSGVAEDLVQGAFLTYWNLPNDRKPPFYGALVNRMRFAAIDHFRKQGKVLSIEMGATLDEDSPAYEPIDIVGEDPSEEASAREAYEKEEYSPDRSVAGKVRDATISLAEPIRDVLDRISRGESFESIAQDLGIAPGVLARRLDYATERVREFSQSDLLSRLNRIEQAAILLSMPVKMRHIVVERRKQIPFGQIAEALELTIEQVRALHFSALKSLRNFVARPARREKLVRRYLARAMFGPVPKEIREKIYEGLSALVPTEREAVIQRWRGMTYRKIGAATSESRKVAQWRVRRTVARLSEVVGQPVKLRSLPRDLVRESDIPSGLFWGLSPDEEMQIKMALADEPEELVDVLVFLHRRVPLWAIGARVGKSRNAVWASAAQLVKRLHKRLEFPPTRKLILAPPAAYREHAEKLGTELFQDLDADRRASLTQVLFKISPRQLKILEWRNEGLSVTRIARRLGTSPSAIRRSIESMLATLGEKLGDELVFKNEEIADDPIEVSVARYFPDATHPAQLAFRAELAAGARPTSALFSMRMQGMAFAELASSFGVPFSTVYSRFYRELANVRHSLGLPPVFRRTRVAERDQSIAEVLEILASTNSIPDEAKGEFRECLGSLAKGDLRLFRARLLGRPVAEIAESSQVTRRRVVNSLGQSIRTLERYTGFFPLKFPEQIETRPRDLDRESRMPDLFADLSDRERESMPTLLSELSDRELIVLTERQETKGWEEIAQAASTDSEHAEILYYAALRKLNAQLGRTQGRGLKLKATESRAAIIEALMTGFFSRLSENHGFRMALASLNEQQLTTIRARTEGISIAEIAERRGVALSNVSRDFNRLRASLEQAAGAAIDFPQPRRRRPALRQSGDAVTCEDSLRRQDTSG